MNTIIKKIKYLILAPLLIKLRNSLLGERNTGVDDFPSKSPLFFIMGSGRNGSTLLALLLGRHNKIFLPPEQYVLPYSIMSWNLLFFKKWKEFCKETINDYANKNQDWSLNTEDFKYLVQILQVYYENNWVISALYIGNTTKFEKTIE